jgi:hypothetical protein
MHARLTIPCPWPIVGKDGLDLIVRPRSKPPTQVSLPPLPGLGVLLLAAVAVLVAAGALARYYSRLSAARRASDDAAVEIPAPELEAVPGRPTPPP